MNILLFQSEEVYLLLNIAFNLVSSDKSVEKHSFLFQADKKFTHFPAIFLNSPKNDTNNQFIIPVFNVVIKTDQGKITEIVW